MIAPELRTPMHAGETVRAVEEVAFIGRTGARSAQLVEVVRDACGDPRGMGEPPETQYGRRALIDLMVLAACVETTIDPSKEKVVLDRARALRVQSPWAAALPALRQSRILSLKRALMSRSPDGRRLMARTWQEDGIAGAVGAAAFVLGIFRDAATAKRFRSYAQLPEGTLGRTLYEHVTSRGMTFPGERGGLPERMIHHDLLHVINGYGTDPAGECELGAFYAGHCVATGEKDWFTFFVTTLATFHLGLAVSPAVVTPAVGAFDSARALAAFDRGLRVRADIMGKWEYLSLMPRPLEEVRQALGIHSSATRSP